MPSPYNGNPTNIVVPTAVGIAASSNGLITTQTAHGLNTNDEVVIYSHQGNTTANNNWVITVIDSTHFSLNGYAATGTGGATGTVQSLACGATYAIPSDGDSRKAASVNPAFSALGDRTALFSASTGPYRYLTHLVTGVDDGTVQNTNWLGSSFTFTAANQWLPVGGGTLGSIQGILQAGDRVYVETTLTVSWSDGAGTGIGLLLALGVAYATTGATFPTGGKVANTGVMVPVQGDQGTNNERTGISLRGYVAIPPTLPPVPQFQSVQFSLMALTRSASFSQMTFTTPGDYSLIATVWRPTIFSGRTG